MILIPKYFSRFDFRNIVLKTTFLILIFANLITVAAGAESLLSSHQAEADARYLREQLEEIHPNLFFSRTRAETEREFQEILVKIRTESTWTRVELYRLLAPFVADFEDGHTFLSIYDEFKKFADRGGNIFPLLVRIEEENILVAANLRGDKPQPGSNILSINDIPSNQIVEETKALVSGAREPFVEAKTSENFPIYLRALYEFPGPFRLTYREPGGDPETVNLEGISAETYRARKDELLGRFELSWDLSFPRSDVALLTINTFAGSYEEEFKEFIRQSFLKIKEKKTENLIIDLRHNGGGSTELSDFLYRHVSSKPFRTFAEVRINYSNPVLKERKIFNPITLARVKLFGQKEIIHRNSFHDPPKTKNRFEGRLFLITGPMTFSTAADFAALIKDVEAGTIVGEETGGLASSYGDVFRDELPNSGLEFGVSFKYFLRPGGFDDGRGVKPDVKIEMDPIGRTNGDDTLLRNLLEKIT